jgi:MFS superfamily sulfate permease-like transporter
MRTVVLLPHRPGQGLGRVVASLHRRPLRPWTVDTRASSTLRSPPSFHRRHVKANLAVTAHGPFHNNNNNNNNLRVLFQSTLSSPHNNNSNNSGNEEKEVQAATFPEKDETYPKTAVVATAPPPNTSYSYDLGLSELIPQWRHMFNPKTLFTDVSAGLTVGCVAVPLSLAIAVASGVPAEVGLVTAAVSGVMGGLMGGTTLAVTGPAAAISLLVVGAVQEHGLEALPFITLACGGLQLASGVTRLGVVTKLVPVSVIAGFTTGVGTLILSGQVPKALGMTAPAGLNPVEIVSFIGENMAAINPASAALALGTSAAMLALPRLHPKIPSALLAVGGATLATHTLGMDVTLIGAIPSGLEAFQFGLPVMPSLEALPSLSASIFLIYAMTSVESLLSCAALDKMKKTSYKYNSNQELVGQGLANMGSAMFMGMPVTSVIARSSLNAKLNAETRLPALVQAGFVFSSVVFMSDKIAMIPMPALSGMLITTGIGMLNPTEFKHCFALQKLDTVPFAATIGGMVSLGLAEGIGIGCASALAMNYINNRKTSETTRMQFHEESTIHSTTVKHLLPAGGAHKPQQDLSSSEHTTNSILNYRMMMPRMKVNEARGLHTMVGFMQPGDDSFQDDAGQALTIDHSRSTVWQIDGPINFVSMFEIDKMVQRIQERKEDDASLGSIVVDMHGVTSLEFTGVEELVNRLVEVADGTPIKMVNCNNPIQNALDQCDPTRLISRYSVLSASP